MSDSLPTYLFILGPTATGKTELALQIAERLNWPIINCDSVQVYQKLNIGSAKPSSEEMRRATHYLFDYVTPPRKLTVADYLDDVLETIEKHGIENAIFVGGSGFYVQALEKGLYPESEASETIKQQVSQLFQSKGPAQLYDWIKQRDPAFAKTLSENDHYRIKRAVEVMKTQDLTMTELKAQMKRDNHSPLPVHTSLKVGLNAQRERLRSRVEARTHKMLVHGLVDEVRALRSEGLGSWAPMQSVGYKEVQAYLDGQLAEDRLAEAITTSTMQLIKKQQTWFKRDSSIHWFEPGDSDKALSWMLEQALLNSKNS